MQETSTVRIITLGDFSVGKTSLIGRYIDGEFKQHSITIGIVTRLTSIKVNGQNCVLQVDDTSAQEINHRILPKSYYKKADGILLVYDLSNANSLQNIRFWIKQINNNSRTKTMILLVGNKADLVSEHECAKGEKIAEELSVRFVRASALNGTGVTEAFNLLVKLIKSNKPDVFVTSLITVESQKPAKKKKCC